MHPYKVSLVVAAALTLCGGVVNAQNNANSGLNAGGLYPNSLGVINQCYHGLSERDPCIRGRFKVSELIRGRWTAERNREESIRPWTIKFYPDSFFHPENGTLSMRTIGPAKSGRYRIVSDFPQDTAIYIDMADGSHYRASIALNGVWQLLLSDENGTTTFRRRVL